MDWHMYYMYLAILAGNCICYFIGFWHRGYLDRKRYPDPPFVWDDGFGTLRDRAAISDEWDDWWEETGRFIYIDDQEEDVPE